jgi:parallel beta-helix repeat protein
MDSIDWGQTMKRHTTRRESISLAIIIFIGIATLAPCTTALVQAPIQPENGSFLSSEDSTYRQNLYVGGTGPNNYSKIQDAVDNASNGDTIFVYKGTYNEHVLITKNMNLIGESQEQTIIDGSGTGNVIKIQADGVTITQFSLQHGGIGVYIVYSSNISIQQSTILNNWEGVGLLSSSYCFISGNIIAHNGFEGINPVQTTFTTISGNSIIDHLQGIYLVESTDNTIFGNVLSSNSRGIEIQESSDNNHLFHNNFYASEEDNAYDTCSNSWDDEYPSGGNHWDDYNGGDANHDGIGDTPYNIPGGGNNKDHYPLMSAWGHPPYQPSDPAPSNGATNVPVNVVLSVFVSDADQDPMTVSFYDASTQQLIGVDENVASSTRATATWDGLENNTMYHWYAIANDGSSTNQSETWEFTTGNGTNQPPTSPTITGPTTGKAGQRYNYTFRSIDPDGRDILYYIDWGDSTNSGWIGPFLSGESVVVSHTWATRGSYTIKAKVKNMIGTESDWGTLSIKMPKSSAQISMFFMNFFERFFERFPDSFPILQHLFYFL